MIDMYVVPLKVIIVGVFFSNKVIISGVLSISVPHRGRLGSVGFLYNVQGPSSDVRITRRHKSVYYFRIGPAVSTVSHSSFLPSFSEVERDKVGK